MQQTPGSDLDGHFDAKRLAGCVVAAGDCLPYSVLHHDIVKIPETAITDASTSPVLNCSRVQVPLISVVSVLLHICHF